MAYSELVQTAVVYAHLFGYGRPFPGYPSVVSEVAAENRILHGTLHAIGVMDLVDDLYALYQKHIDGFEDTIQEIASAFQCTSNELLDYIRVTAMFHDIGRKADGVDYWDKESAENLENFILTQKNDSYFAQFCRSIIEYKDAPDLLIERDSNNQIKRIEEAFIPTVTEILKEKNPDFSGNVDVIRHLVSTGDALEVIRTRNLFIHDYLPVSQLKSKISQESLYSDLDALVAKTHQRVWKENRYNTNMTKTPFVAQTEELARRRIGFYLPEVNVEKTHRQAFNEKMMEIFPNWEDANRIIDSIVEQNIVCSKQKGIIQMASADELKELFMQSVAVEQPISINPPFII